MNPLKFEFSKITNIFTNISKMTFKRQNLYNNLKAHEVNQNKYKVMKDLWY